MAKKMYYTEAEAAGKLGVTPDQLAGQVREGKLRVFQSGGQKMFKADEVDALAGGGEEEIELAPASGDAVDLSAAAPSSKPPGKEDTVITAAGISIFDDEELEIEPADPMAKTQIAPSLEEQMSTEGVGSGSGLLDLTRESDDTSLGAEVLDHIDVEGGLGSSIAAAEPPAAEAPHPATVVVAEAPAEVLDASSGLFGGLAVACAAVAILLGTVVAAAAQGLLPSYVKAMKENVSLVLIAVVFLLAVGAVAGWMVGKGAAARQVALKKMGA
jgi:hypothetical protein